MAVRYESIEARVTREQLALFQRAADISDRSLADFVVESLQETAAHLMREQETITLIRADREAFADALLDPPRPSARLMRVAHRGPKNRSPL